MDQHARQVCDINDKLFNFLIIWKVQHASGTEAKQLVTKCMPTNPWAKAVDWQGILPSAAVSFLIYCSLVARFTCVGRAPKTDEEHRVAALECSLRL